MWKKSKFFYFLFLFFGHSASRLGVLWHLGDFEAFPHVLTWQEINICKSLLQLLLKSIYYNLVLPTNNSMESLF